MSRRRNAATTGPVAEDVSFVAGAVRRVLEWLRSPTPDEHRPDDLVVLPLGGDIFEAEVTAAACRAAGVRVELLVTEMGQHPASAGVQQQLLVRAEDLDAVQSILTVTPGSRSVTGRGAALRRSDRP